MSDFKKPAQAALHGAPGGSQPSPRPKGSPRQRHRHTSHSQWGQALAPGASHRRSERWPRFRQSPVPRGHTPPAVPPWNPSPLRFGVLAARPHRHWSPKAGAPRKTPSHWRPVASSDVLGALWPWACRYCRCWLESPGAPFRPAPWTVPETSFLEPLLFSAVPRPGCPACAEVSVPRAGDVGKSPRGAPRFDPINRSQRSPKTKISSSPLVHLVGPD